MDIAIPKKKRSIAKRVSILLLLLLLLALVLSFLLSILWYFSQADFSIDRESLVFSEVKRGQFTVSVRGTGVLVPDNIHWISAEVEAKVVKIRVKAGNLVKTGDVLVELSNPQLRQQLAEAQWELEAKLAESIAAKVAQESALLEQKAKVLNAKLDYESSLLTYNAQLELFNRSTRSIAEITHKRTRLETEQFKQRWLISQEQSAKMQENLLAQNNARAARLRKTKRRLQRIQQQVDNLQVKATMNSMVLEMPLELGQRIRMNANIAKLAQRDSLIAELQVPEIQIPDVAVGQRVIIDTRNNKIEGLVSRVDPAVINGDVQVDVTFSESLPDDARTDLSVDGEIIITAISDTLYVARPLFAQSRSRSAFYTLVQENQFIQRVQVETGYGSINQIQILEGLQVGDRIVISDPSRLETYEKIRIH